MKALILGMGMSGRSAAKLLLQKGYQVQGLDKNYESIQLPGIVVTSDQDPIELTPFDLLVISPGISLDHPIAKAAKEKRIEIVGEIELACRFIKNRFFAITGTNGKTTVTLLVTHVLNQSGIPAKALGNLGVPLAADLEVLRDEVVVVELSSYQLETMTSKIIDAGVILNITPDHLDRYSSMEEYAKAKIHMKECLKPGAHLYVFKQVMDEFGPLFERFNLEKAVQHDKSSQDSDSRPKPADYHITNSVRGNQPVIGCGSEGCEDLLRSTAFSRFSPKTYGYSIDCDYFIQENAFRNKENIEWLLPICYRRGVSHDIENIMAAYLLCKEAGISAVEFLKALETFKKPAHRIEFVRRCRDINYFNDSKGTNIDAVIRAVDTMEGPVVLIAGGVDKGSTYSPWLHAFKQKVKYVCVIGEASDKIEKEISHSYTVKKFTSLEEAVKHAAEIAKPGENVLLSPGCSSFDMFRNYAHRGEEFKRIVNEL